MPQTFPEAVFPSGFANVCRELIAVHREAAPRVQLLARGPTRLVAARLPIASANSGLRDRTGECVQLTSRPSLIARLVAIPPDRTRYSPPRCDAERARSSEITDRRGAALREYSNAIRNRRTRDRSARFFRDRAARVPRCIAGALS